MAFPYSRITVAVDMTAPTRSALGAATFLARRWKSMLELLHVEPAEPHGGGYAAPLAGGYWWPYADFQDWRKEKLLRALRDFPAKRIRAHSLPGWPPIMLAELAKRRPGGLLVMGTHGYAGVDRALFGSVAEAVVRGARNPVLVIHDRRGTWRPRRVLAPWNGMPYATEALREAARWAKSLGARLEVLHVDPPWSRKSDAAARLRHLLAKALPGAERPSVAIRLGDPREEIVRAAEGADLLVLAAHRRPFSSDMVLGSTVERALRHCRTPLLAVPSNGHRTKSTDLPPSSWFTGQPYIF